MIRRVVRIAVTVIAVAALAGCARLSSVNSFGTDNTVTQDTIVALTPEAAQQLGIDVKDLTAESLRAVTDDAFPGIDPSKITIEDYSEGDRRGVHVVVRDMTLDEFNGMATSTQDWATGGLSTPMTVVREGNTYVVTIPADPYRDLSQASDGGAAGLLAQSVDVSVTMTFPGPVKSASRGHIDGKKVVLGIEDLLTPDEIVIKGQATHGIAWDPILRWAGIGAIAVVIFGGAALLVWQDKRKQRQNNLPPIPDASEGSPDVL